MKTRTLFRLSLTGTFLFIAMILCTPTGFAQSQETTPSQITSALGFLEMLGYSESELSFLCDAPELDPSSEPLQKLLTNVVRIPRWRAYQWRLRDVPWSEIQSDAKKFRGQLVSLTGRLTEVTNLQVAADQVEKRGFQRYVACTIVDQENEISATVVTKALPRTLQNILDGMPGDITIDERVRVTGLFTRFDGDSTTKPASPILVAREIEWFPDDVQSQLVRSADHVLLASMGMDIGRLDEVTDRKPLLAEDRECFYQMLAALGRSDSRTLNAQAKPSGAMQLLTNPAEHRGQLYSVIGTARRALRVAVEDPDIVERFGITHYYEIEVFDSQARVRVKTKQGSNGKNSDDAVYNSYPIVFCTRVLPDWMSSGDVIHENVEITGAYLKLWAYRSRFLNEAMGTTANQKKPVQLSPLLIGNTLRRIDSPATSNPKAGLAVGIAFGLALTALSFLVWRANQGDKQFRSSTLDRFDSPQDSLDPSTFADLDP